MIYILQGESPLHNATSAAAVAALVSGGARVDALTHEVASAFSSRETAS